jgi:PAS domain S-box-containing protein
MKPRHNSSPPQAEVAELRAQLAEAQARLAESEETLEAIRTGAVDALVVAGPAGNRVFSLAGAETPYRSLVEEINQGALLLRPDGTILYANARFAELADTPLEQVTGSLCRHFFPAADCLRLDALLGAACHHGRHWAEFSLQTQSEPGRPVEVTISPLKGTPTETLSAIVTDLTERNGAKLALRQANEALEVRIHQRTSDLTRANESLLLGSLRQHELTEEAERLNGQLRVEIAERRRVEAALKTNETLYRQLVDLLPVAVYTVDAKGFLTLFNRQAVQLFGREPQLGKDRWCGSYRLYHADGSPVSQEECPLAAELREGPCVQPCAQGDEIIIERPDGSRSWVMPVPQQLRDASGKLIGAIYVLIDLTERKVAEEALTRLAAIVQWSEDGIISKAMDGTIRTWNAGAERMFGYTAQEVIGRPVTILIPPDQLDEENEVLELLKGGKATEHFETVRLTKAGRRLDVSLTISPLKDNQGRIVGASKIVRDIGDLVLARQVLARSKEDLERLVDQRTAELREAMADLEHMSYSMVHDMRAPLRGMQAFATMLEQECAGCSQPPGSDYLRRIRGSATRLDRLVTDALNYNRVVRQELPITPIEVGKLMRGMLEVYPDLQPAAADITIDFNELVVLGNESLLTQVFGNLLGNAVKFVPPGVRPHIRVHAQSSPPNHPTSTFIYVEDNGIGIPKEAHEKIFLMFQRMHRENEYPGTGIGLAIVKKAIERMGGQVGLESEPGHGCRFWIELPAPTEAVTAPPMEHAA